MKSIISGSLRAMACAALALMFSASALVAADWTIPGDFPTITDALASPSVGNSDRIFLAPGNHAGAYVTKPVEIRGEGKATINTGPAHDSGLIMGFRLLAGSGGATFTQLRFTVDLAIMNGAAVDDVTVSHCVFENAVQAISNWRGSRWDISQNVITDLRTRNGGGIGILVGDYTGGAVTDNLIAHNKITGVIHVDPADGGGYDGTGIVLYADFRWGALGATAIAYNRVIKNKVSLVSDTPAVVDVNAIELTQGYYPSAPAVIPIVIFENSIGFNDLRGTAEQIVLTPSTLDNPANTISRNLGENRGGGVHPSLLLKPIEP